MTTNINKGDDGTYRWVYEFRMLRNPIILLTVWKIFALVLVGMWLLFGLFSIGDKGLLGAYAAQAAELALPAAILFSLSLEGYFILACIYGFRYCVLFEMNEESIRHIQMEKQFKKAQALGWLTAMAGLAAGNPGTAGAGLLSAARNVMVSEFSKVRHVRPRRSFHTIKLDAPLSHNQIYADGADFDFVLNYINEHMK